MTPKAYIEAFEALMRAQGRGITRQFTSIDPCQPCVQWTMDDRVLVVNLRHLPPFDALLAIADSAITLMV